MLLPTPHLSPLTRVPWYKQLLSLGSLTENWTCPNGTGGGSGGLMEGWGPEHLGGSLHSGCCGNVEAPLPKAEHRFVAALLGLHNIDVDLLQTRAQRAQGIV